MIKAVFFDLYHTLVRFEPPREETEVGALKDCGIEVKPEALRRPLVMADEFINREIARTPLRQRSEPDRKALFAGHQAVLLREAGIEASAELVLALLGKVQQVKTRLVRFDDVIPALTGLKNNGLILGLISNVDRDITPLLNEVELTALLQVLVTSLEVGFSKPRPEIFRAALARAGVQPSQAIYVGDQYQVDIVGAEKAGLKGILLDRGGYFAGINDCPRVQSLTGVAEYLSDQPWTAPH